MDVKREFRKAGKMGNAKSLSGQKMSSRFLPEEQAEVDKLFDALSSSDGEPRQGGSSPSHGHQTLQRHVEGEADRQGPRELQ